MVLTGGASRRMGRDKAAIEIDGETMAERVAAALRAAGAAEVGRVGDAIPDLHPGAGPLGGLITALRWAGGRPAVVLACDLVRPSPAAIVRAIERLSSSTSGAVALPVVAGRDQWLHAAWDPERSLDHLAGRFDQGERSIHRAARGLPVSRYDEPDGPALADADTPADLPPGAR